MLNCKFNNSIKVLSFNRRFIYNKLAKKVGIFFFSVTKHKRSPYLIPVKRHVIQGPPTKKNIFGNMSSG